MTWNVSRTWSYRDDQIAWDVVGTGPAVVLVHGFPGSAFSWRRLVPRLATRRRVYVVDLAGFGASSRRVGQQVGLRYQARLLDELIREWGLTEPDVVAHDMGAAVTAGSALLDGRRYRRVVLLAPALLDPCLRDNSRHIRRHHDVYASMPAALFEQLVRFVLPTTMASPMDEDTLAGYAAPWHGAEGQAGYCRFLAQFDDAHLERLERELPRWDRPVRIVWGTEDGWIPPTQSHRLRAVLPDAQVELIEGAGHFSMEDRPDDVALAIERALDA